jgi:mevalonate kinase
MNEKQPQITASAPGKLMLLGEHAVVYGRPCLVTAVGRWQATVAPASDNLLHVTAPDVGLFDCALPLTGSVGEVPTGARFIAAAVQEFRRQHGGRGGLRVSTSSHFSSRYGLGSSAAVTVAMLQALAAWHGVPLSERELFDLGRRAVLAVQGVGSGFDVAAAVYGGTLYFAAGGPTIEPLTVNDLQGLVKVSISSLRAQRSNLSHGATVRLLCFVSFARLRTGSRNRSAPLKRHHALLPETAGVMALHRNDSQNDFDRAGGDLPLVVGYSGVKADTSTLVRGVAARRAAAPQETDRLFDESAILVEAGRQALQAGDFATLGSLFDQAQELLVRLGVSTPRLEALIAAAREAGAWGAKLSGAGGGDCLIALVPAARRQAVEAAIVAAGGELVAVRPGEPGARLEVSGVG